MKKIYLLLLITCSLFSSNLDKFSRENNFQRDFKTAINKAKNDNKPLLMVLGADYCPWCRKFERKTLTNSKVLRYLKENFIVLMVDKTYDVNSFPAEFHTKITPRVFFINPLTKKKFYENAGYVKKNVFFEELIKSKKLYEGLK